MKRSHSPRSAFFPSYYCTRCRITPRQFSVEVVSSEPGQELLVSLGRLRVYLTPAATRTAAKR